MAKFDQGGGCPCGLYRECEPGCAYDPDMVLLAENAKAHASALSAARDAVVEAAKRWGGLEKAFWGAPNDTPSAMLMALNRDLASAETELEAATDALIALEEQKP